MCCPDLSLDIVHLGSDVVISLQVLCRWLCQLLAIIPGMANDKRETEAAAAEVKKVVSFCLCLSIVVKLQLVLLL